VSIVDDSCIRCGICLPACPHDAIDALGNLQVAESLLGEPGTVLILGTEAPAHFYPAIPEQVINACYAAGFQVVSRGVLGDELVAAEYMRLWEKEEWGTLIRSTDPVVVGAVCMDYPQLIPYLAPVSTPPVAEARYLKWLGGAGLKVVYAGSWPISADGDIAATITFEDLQQLFRNRGVDVLAQPGFFSRVPMERRRHLSLAGGFPAPWLTRTREDIPKVLRIRGLDGLKALARTVTGPAKVDLGFVDILSVEGALDLPISGPREDLLWRRAVVQTSEPPRSPEPIVDPVLGRGHIRAAAAPCRGVGSGQGRGDPDPDRDRAVGQGVGLRGLRLPDLQGIRRGGGAGTDVASTLSALPGPDRGDRCADRAGDQADSDGASGPGARTE
jgi:ferredoxin